MQDQITENSLIINNTNEELNEELSEETKDTDIPNWSELSIARRRSIIEAVIFASEQPVQISEISKILGVSKKEIAVIVDSIIISTKNHDRGIVLEEISGGLVFRTKPELSIWLKLWIKARPMKLSRASMECLAIIAYRQPSTRAEIEEIRGVDSGTIIKNLLEKQIIRILGRKEDVGRPILYGTTKEFLQIFGLKDLSALPTLKDIKSLLERTTGPKPLSEV